MLKPAENFSTQMLGLLLVVFVLCVSYLYGSGLVIALGKNISQADILTDYAFGIFFATLIGLSIFFWPVPNQDKKALLLIWVVKSIVVLCCMLFYESNYSFLDAYAYFNVPQRIDFSWNGLVLGAGTENIYNLVWLYYKVFPYSYHALKIVFALLGLVAVYVTYRAVVLFLRREDLRIFYLVALFPSILFWSSILGKDPIALFGVTLYVYGVIAWYRLRKTCYLIMLLFAAVVLMYLRVWLIPIIIIPLLLTYLIVTPGLLRKLLILSFSAVALLLTYQWFVQQFMLGSTHDLIEMLPNVAQGWSYGGSGQVITQDLTRPSGLITFLPSGIFTALLRPLPGEMNNFFGILAGIENAILLALLLRAIVRTRLIDFKDPIILWISLFILVWAIVYGFLSYQNLGTAVRFRLQILPVFLLLLIYLGRKRKECICVES